MSPRHDPLSGEGARIHGGRFNPPDSFPVLYLCLSRECSVAEFLRMANRQVIGVAGLLPWRLYTYRLGLARVLDLDDPAIRDPLGLSESELVDPDQSLTREIGVIARGLLVQAVRSPSATGVGSVLALFQENLGSGHIEANVAEEWTSPDQFR